MNIDKLVNHLPISIFEELKGILENRVITKIQLAHLLSQFAHETANWTKFRESLNYSPERLFQVFGKSGRIKSLDHARKVVAEGQVAIGDAVYGGRMGNKKGTRDGFDFRGRGCPQLTGRTNYTLFDASVVENIVQNPDLVETKYKLTSGFWFFDVNKIWVLASGNNQEDVIKVTKRINGGTNGLHDRLDYFRKYCNLME